MGKMKFNKLKISNFLAVKNIEITFDDIGPLLLVQGNNGVGKSTIFSDSISWALFGRMARGNCPALSLSGEEAVVTIEMEVGNEVLEVTRKQNSKGNHLFLRVNGEDFKGRIKTLTEEIRQRIGSPEMFLALSVFDQGFNHRLTSLNGTDRMTFMELFTGAELYERAEERTSSQLKLSREEKHSLGFEKSSQEAQLTNYNADLYRVEEVYSERKVALASQAQQRQADITALQQQKQVVEQTIQSLKSHIVQQEQIVQSCRSTLVILDERINKGTGLIASTQTSLETLRKRREDLLILSAGGSTCPTCKQPIPQALMSELQSTVSTGLITFEENLALYTKTMGGLCQQRNEVEKQAQNAHAEIIKFNSQVCQAEQDLGGIQANLRNRESENDGERSLLESYDQQKMGILERICKAKDAITAIEKQEEDLEKKISCLEFWHKGFSVKGIRSYLMDGLLTRVNTMLETLSATLFDNTLQISLSPEEELKSGDVRNRLVPRVDTQDGRLVYRALSGGQKRCVDIAIHLALRQLAEEMIGFGSNLLIADEVFDSLDYHATEEVVRLLSLIPDKVIVITHEPKLKEHFSEVITVERTNGHVVLT